MYFLCTSEIAVIDVYWITECANIQNVTQVRHLLKFNQSRGESTSYDLLQLHLILLGLSIDWVLYPWHILQYAKRTL